MLYVMTPETVYQRFRKKRITTVTCLEYDNVMYSWSRSSSSVSGVDVLDAAEICDLLKGVVLISCCVV